MVRYRTPHTATQNIKKKGRKRKTAKKKLSVPVLNNGKTKLALSCLMIYILFHPLKRPAS